VNRWWRGWLLLAVLAVFFGALLFYPLSFSVVKAVTAKGKFTWAFVTGTFQDPVQREGILTSLMVGLLVTAGTTLVALPLAIIQARYRFAGKWLLTGLVLLPMIMPPFVGAIGMRQLLARYSGSINLLLGQLGVLRPGQFIDWLGSMRFWGVVLLEVLHLYPIMLLNLAAALANVDPRMEEAALNLGAGRWRLFRKVTLPLSLPGYFAGAVIVFVWAFTDLGTPLVFGYRKVVPVQIFDRLKEINENPQGYALVVVVLAVTVLAFALAKLVLGRSRGAMMSKGTTARELRQAGAMQTVGFYVLFGAVTLVACLPHIGVVLTSVAERWFATILPSNYTAGHFKAALGHDLTLPSIRNSILYSSASTLVDLVLGVMIAYAVSRRRVPMRHVVDATTMLPLGLPGIVLAFGFVGAFSGTPIDPRGNPTFLLVAAYAVRRLPYVVRAAYAGFEQVSERLEEAARNLGAGPARTLIKITAPLVSPNLIAGGILAFSFAMLEVSDSLILAFRERFYPLTKTIYELFGRLGDGPNIASALGVWAMVFLAVSLVGAGTALGKRMGQLFRI